jgi:hypothetical protein
VIWRSHAQSASRPCNESGCPALVYDGARYCDEHYRPWVGHTKHKGIDGREKRQNTEAHRRFKSRVLGAAGYRCQIRKQGRCIGAATEVDRIDNTREYTDDNCQAACSPCHEWKTSMEGHAAQGHNVDP